VHWLAESEYWPGGHKTVQMRTGLSSLPLTIRELSGEKATDQTVPVCPVRVFMDVPVAASQMCTVFALPLAIFVPSGE
jgi:hypothetical protein